jgi:hypothetical protein
MGILVWERSIGVLCHQTKEGLVGMGGSSDEQEELSGGEWVIASGVTHDKSERRTEKRSRGALLLNKVLVKVEE